MNRADDHFPSMGGEARIRLESAVHDDDDLEACLVAIREVIVATERTLTRFVPDSELSMLNRDPRRAVPASPLLQRFVLAARWARSRSGGLVDATLAGDIERAGYATSRAGLPPARLDVALRHAPPRHPARPRRGRTPLAVDERGFVVRPPGVRLDSGGLGKGLAADLAAATLPPGVRYAISCGGDLAVGGGWDIAVADAWTREEGHRLHVGSGGVATSGLDRRIWRRADGSYAHHLLDPSTGEPAWTGLVSATAVGASALEAEVLAKSALLSGPEGARRLLRTRGGVLQHDDGRLEPVAGFPVAVLEPVG